MKLAKSIGRVLPVAILVSGLMVGGFAAAASAASKAPADPASGSSFKQRLVQRKKEQHIKLSKQDAQHLQQQCSNAQTKIRTAQSQATPMLTNRNSTYKNIDAVVIVNVGKLKLANQPTFKLEQQQAALEQKAADFQKTSTNYEQTLNDLLVINCPSDAAGFQALLNTARDYYSELASQSKDIYGYTVNTVQPTLQGFIGPLQVNGSNQGGQ